MPRGSGDPGQTYIASKRLLQELEALNQEDRSRHNPRAKSWMDKVREFFAE